MGTRPEIIKMAPVYRAFAASGANVAVLHTGQHEEMAWPLYEFFGISPPHVLQLNRESPSLSHLSARLLETIGRALETMRPDVVLVHGDTSSALMGALAAFYSQIPVAHVEAGLRTGERYDPFPEEKNREIIGRLAHWHFAPTSQAVLNLRREGIETSCIHHVGNTVVDAARWGIQQLDQLGSASTPVLPESLATLPEIIEGTRLILVTAHRRENWGGGIRRIAESIRSWIERHEDSIVVWPVHGNPRVEQEVREVFESMSARVRRRLLLCEPLGYPALLWVMCRAWIILTDSGGLQEEALSVQRPVLVLRETTERPEVLKCGAGLLVGTCPTTILDALHRLRESPQLYETMCAARNPFGDGRAAERIVAILRKELSASDAPARQRLGAVPRTSSQDASTGLVPAPLWVPA